MILIFSTQDWERTTEEVMDWITALGGRCIRLNGEDLIGDEPYALVLADGTDGARLRLGDDELDLSEVGAVWYRRGGRFASYSVHSEVDEDHEVSTQLDAHLRAEMSATAASVHALLSDRPWLTRPDQARINKTAALRTAAGVGLDVPATLVTNSRRELEAFQSRHPSLVTKAISDGTAFYLGDRRFTIYTEEVRPEDVEELPETFLPTLAQERLDKEYEVRVFYLEGRCYAMAIFSQRDPQTTIDFRRYNLGRPNRSVPYRLDRDTERRIGELMDRLDLPTGSLDFVRTVDGRLVFLEVNPVGQFGMVSKPCNYPLERLVAEHLLRLEGRHPVEVTT